MNAANNSESKTLKVLIAVDIQNCFIHGGSLAAPLLKSTGEAGKFHKTNVITKHFKNIKNYQDSGTDSGSVASVQLATDALEMMKGKDIVVITRDSHPHNHSSFDIYGYPGHCRKRGDFPKLHKCAPTPKGVAAGMTGGATYGSEGKEIIGTNPSFVYGLLAEEHPEFKPYVEKINNCDLKVGLTDNEINLAPTGNNTFQCSKNSERSAGLPLFIDLRKGEYCAHDAYSGFMYHVTYNVASDPTGMTIENKHGEPSPKMSTMLLEILLSKMVRSTTKSEYDKIEIDVCGLVGNICVMYTVSYGNAYAKWAAGNKEAFLANYARINGLTDSQPDLIPPIFFKYHARKGTNFLRILPDESGNPKPFKFNWNGFQTEWPSNFSKTTYPVSVMDALSGKDVGAYPDVNKFEKEMVEYEMTRLDSDALTTTVTLLEFTTAGGRRRRSTRRFPKRRGTKRAGTRRHRKY